MRELNHPENDPVPLSALDPEAVRHARDSRILERELIDAQRRAVIGLRFRGVIDDG